MRTIIDIKGKKFNRLFVLSLAYVRRRAFWNCLCDCGRKKIIESREIRVGHTKSCGCLNNEKRVERIKKWSNLPTEKKNLKGRTRLDGYKYKINHSNPNKSKENYVAEHRLVAEKMIGRFLKQKEVVHHWDEDTSNNSPENLCVLRSQSAHNRLHFFARRNKIKVEKLKFKQDWLYVDCII